MGVGILTTELIEDYIQVIDGKQELTTDMTIEAELAHLFLKVSFEGKNTMQAKQKEISHIHMRKNQKVFKKLLPEIIFYTNHHTIFSIHEHYELVKKKLTYRNLKEANHQSLDEALRVHL